MSTTSVGSRLSGLGAMAAPRRSPVVEAAAASVASVPSASRPVRLPRDAAAQAAERPMTAGRANVAERRIAPRREGRERVPGINGGAEGAPDWTGAGGS